MAEAIITAFLQIVCQQLTSPILTEYGVIRGVSKQLKKLSRILSRIQAVQSDAEQRYIQEEAVRIWLRDLKDVAYDADDLLDEIATEALRSSQVRKFFSSFSVAPKINDILERLEEIAVERDDLHLREETGKRRPGSYGIKGRPQTSSLVDESCVFGRNVEKEKIVSFLLSPESSAKQVSVIAVVGMGGVGKTTLVQLVYNDERVEEHFELSMWVCVFENFDVRKITRAIIESATGCRTDLLDMDLMQRRLQNTLKGRRFLLVLDDVWNENDTTWDTLQVPLMVGGNGSKIIVTTRSKIVSLIIGTSTSQAHYLNGLSNEDCWSLLKLRVCGKRNSDLPPNVVTVGKKIVNRCQGLPLAVKNFGTLLKFADDEKKWNAVLNMDICELPEDKNEILPNLRISYQQLPTHLKLCFGFCSMFPQEYVFEKERLVLLWIAEGFIQPKGGKVMEDIADDYFFELLSKSFFQYSHIDPLDELPRYRMHSLVHDLARSVMHDECLRLEANKVCDLQTRPRHVSLIFDQVARQEYAGLYKCKSLRTLLFMGGYRYCIEHIPSDVFLNLKCLRVLDMSHTSISELPNSIGNLKHLRFLDLSWTRIERLPESITTLVNLQVLNLIKCLELMELPVDMNNLINLRHLNISYSTVLLRIIPFCDRRLLELPKYLRNLINLRDINTSFSSDLTNILPSLERSSQLHPFSRLISTPPGIGRLTSLQTLSNFVVTKTSGCGIEELKNLVNLRGSLRISKLENVVDVIEAEEASLMNKPGISELTLHWSETNLFGLRNPRLNEEVLEALQPHENLKELRVEYYGGTIFPSWIGSGVVANLETLCLLNCQNCRHLPPLWYLPFLKNLKLHGMHGLKHVSSEFCGDSAVRGFLSLETLEIKDMPNLEDWSGIEFGEFPCLRELTIWDCPKLEGLRQLPLTLKVFEIASCKRLMSLPSLPMIQNLVLGQCDNMILSSLVCFPSLSSLTVSHFPNLECFPGDLLQHLGSLKELKIIDCDKFKSLPKENGLQKLTSLEQLEFCSCISLNCLLDEKLSYSLKTFRVVSCPGLISLPKEITNLGSLQLLEIWKCPKLLSLPGNKLPATLQMLSIRECLALKEAFRKGRNDWHKIAHIPNIRMDSEWLQQKW